MEQSLTSKNSLFHERWSRAEVVNGRLGVVLMAMTGICLTLTAALVYGMSRPKPVYCIPGLATAKVVYPQENPESIKAVFAASWVLNWTNFTPATVDDVYKRAQQLMSPRFLNQTRVRLKKDVEQVKANNVSSMFSLTKDPSVQEEEDGYSVTLQGDKGIFMGKEEIKTQKTIYRIRLLSTQATDRNPYGLIIEDVSQETAL
ncbi:MAG: hypothetical protein HQL15_08555 [Candidatus Omnitrophica bacterium]|nr:hypothetical protein [Candidatus Omnitrophota bacterium]